MMVIEGLSNVHWKYMYVELSTGREGAKSVDQLMSLLRKTQPQASAIKKMSNKCFTDVYVISNS